MIIYKTVNKMNGHYYIGKDEKNKDSYLGSGLVLGRAITKYGRDNFTKEVLEECPDSNTLAEREKFWIKKYNAVLDPESYNIHHGGKGGNTGAYHKVGRKGELNSQYGRKWTKSERQEHSEILKEIRKNENPDILADRYRRSSETQKGQPKNSESVKKMKETKLKRFAENNITYKQYQLISPTKIKFQFNSLVELTHWCKDNGYSIWTVQCRLLKNIQPKSGTLVGWTATVRDCFTKSRRTQLARL